MTIDAAVPSPSLPAIHPEMPGNDVVVAGPVEGVEYIGPVEERVRRVKAKVLEENDPLLQKFLAYEGEVPTAEFGSLESVTDQQRKDAAYLSEDGVLLIARHNPASPWLIMLKVILKKSNRPINEEYLVPPETIQKINDAFRKRRGTASRARTSSSQMQAMQQQFINLVADAAHRKASDIHMVIGRYESEIRFRVDGILEMIRHEKVSWSHELCTAAFNMADASDSSYRPLEYQGARVSNIRTPLPDNVQSVRLQFNPLMSGGRYMVCRLLYEANNLNDATDVDVLGYNSHHIAQIKQMRNMPYGINIICGPTGSGKSTTLQKALTALMREKKNTINVITIEDPPEYVIAGAAQLPVLNAQSDEERHEKFRQAISGGLRSDPDVVMIGEIRDRASASLAFQAAMTGHQVWASLHANDAPSCLDRLRDLGIENYKLTDETLVTGLMSQRLIRRLCDDCKVPILEVEKRGLKDVPEDLVESVRRCVGEERLASVCLANPASKGCKCRAGYTGRTVVAETLMPDRHFMELVRSDRKFDALKYWFESLEGSTLHEHGIQKMVLGQCDPRDVATTAGPLSRFDQARTEIVFGPLNTHPLAA